MESFFKYGGLQHVERIQGMHESQIPYERCELDFHKNGDRHTVSARHKIPVAGQASPLNLLVEKGWKKK
ncbi:MAG TPA: hypothetical protein VE154_05560, partial [Chthoniobacterales bacterium]|nr:hypothetical protein [Chthoniobacterales bacterium]